MITNTVRNILTGFGASSAQGGTTSTTGAPGGTPPSVNAVVQFAAGKPGISVGYAKLKVSGLAGGADPFAIGIAIYASDQVNLQECIAMATFPASVAPPNGWWSDMIFPFCGDRQYTWFSAQVYFEAGTTSATVDFEVWGNAMAGGQ